MRNQLAGSYRLMIMLHRVLVVFLALGALTSCSGDASRDAAPDRAEAPPSQDGAVVAAPATAQPGQQIDLRFPTEIERGVCWLMSEREGTGWADPQYHLVSAPDGYDNDQAPSWTPQGEDWECDFIGISGPGPDPIVLPATAAPGEHRLCAANTGGDHYCTTIRIETDDEPTRVVTVNPGDTSGCVQMISIDTGENYFFNFDPINGSSPAYDTQSCNDIHIPGDTFDIPIPDNVPDGTYRFCLQDCQTIRVG